MVSSIAEATENKKAEIGSTTAASLEPLELAKVAAGQLQYIMAKGRKTNFCLLFSVAPAMDDTIFNRD